MESKKLDLDDLVWTVYLDSVSFAAMASSQREALKPKELWRTRSVRHSSLGFKALLLTRIMGVKIILNL